MTDLKTDILLIYNESNFSLKYYQFDYYLAKYYIHKMKWCERLPSCHTDFR